MQSTAKSNALSLYLNVSRKTSPKGDNPIPSSSERPAWSRHPSRLNPTGKHSFREAMRKGNPTQALSFRPIQLPGERGALES